MKAVILQPMYLPWMGYYGLIDIADVFVFYDDVQFVERSWQRRNKIKMPNGTSIWLSVPVEKSFGQKINEVLIKNEIDWSTKHVKSMKHAYNKTPFFTDYYHIFEEIYKKEWKYLADLDLTIIKTISELLGIDNTEFVLASDLNAQGQKTDRLISILKNIGADEYISGPSAKAYVEHNKFQDNRIKLYWYEFDHPKYQQIYGDFIPYLSGVDLLFNTGKDSITYIRKGAEKALILDENMR